jgi:hypothetical protein
MLTNQERSYCEATERRASKARDFLTTNSLAGELQPTALFEFLSKLRQIQGRPMAALAFLWRLAKEYQDRLDKLTQ